MELARIYEVKRRDEYKYMVQFKRVGMKDYRRYFKLKKEAEKDRDAFNDKMLKEGRTGLNIRMEMSLT